MLHCLAAPDNEGGGWKIQQCILSEARSILEWSDHTSFCPICKVLSLLTSPLAIFDLFREGLSDNLNDEKFCLTPHVATIHVMELRISIFDLCIISSRPNANQPFPA
jgi:hypothetical protein